MAQNQPSVTDPAAPPARPTKSPEAYRDELFDLLAEALLDLALSSCLEAEAEPVCPTRRA